MEITEVEIESYLKSLSPRFNKVQEVGSTEVIYVLPLLKNPNILIRVGTGISSIDKTTRRNRAIMLNMISSKHNDKVIKSCKRINKSAGWKDRLREKIFSLGLSYTECLCPECNNPDAVLLVRTNRLDKTNFYGCINYPNCKYIRKI